jgi:uncharacterized protein YecE (DUF72 family)
VEVRHDSFKDERFVKLLRKHNIALVFADTAGRWPYMEDVTADFIYIRLHGDEELYVSGYTDAALDWWADRIRSWQCGQEPPDATRVLDQNGRRCRNRDVYVYFDNDVKVRAPFDAKNLAARLAGRETTAAPEMLIRKGDELPRTRWPGFQKRDGLRMTFSGDRHGETSTYPAAGSRDRHRLPYRRHARERHR